MGDKVSYRNDNIIISADTDGKKTIKYQQSCYKIFMLLIIGDCTITTGIIRRAKKYGFAICFMTYSYRLYGKVNAPLEGNTYLRRCQYEYHDMELAIHTILNKVQNQCATLKKIRKKVPLEKEAIAVLNNNVQMLLESNDIERNTLLSIEGNSAKVYFSALFSLTGWKGRKPRIKFDYLNCLLDIGYTILFNFIDCLLEVYGFDVYQGYLHTNFYMRKSLVCDVMEPFRPLIDWRVRKGISLGQFKKEDFVEIKNQWQLDYKKSTTYSAIFMKDILERKEDIFRYIRTFYRSFMKKKEIKEYPTFDIEMSKDE